MATNETATNETAAIDTRPRPDLSPASAADAAPLRTEGRLSALRPGRLRQILRLPGAPSIVLGAVVVAVFVLMAVFAPLLAPHSPIEQDLQGLRLPPSWVDGGHPDHLLGTDQLGRDVLSRLIYGSRISLLVGLAAVIGGGVTGVLVGVVSAFRGGRLDYVVQRVCELFQAFPFLLLGITVMAFLGQGVGNLIIVLILTRWVQFCRVVRAEVLSLRTREFMLAAQSMGSRITRTTFRHVLPNVMAPIIVVATFSLASAIIGEASLSFLGVGVPPTVPTWGSMLSGAQGYMFSQPWLSVWPGLMLFLLVIAVNVLGDGLRDLNDPKLRGRQ